MLGAIREDDVPFDDGAIENTPQDDPGGSFYRVFRHFFDPYNNRPLTVGVALGYRAPDWAIQADDNLITYSDGSTVEMRGNHFSVAQAREAMWRAATLKQMPTQLSVTGALSDLPFSPSGSIPTREALRRTYWATTFRSLGDAVHLLQDMAQPQHTRNDPHSGTQCVLGKCLGGHASYYEGYVEARATGAKKFTLRERSFITGHDDFNEPVAAVALDFGGYPIPRFSSYRDYFSSGTSMASLTGKGLANYTNQGFYSLGTIAGSYGSPPSNPSVLAAILIPEGLVTNAAGGKIVSGNLQLLAGTVADAANPAYSDNGVPLAAFGAFDQFMKAQGAAQITLNHYVYVNQARLLIPRAVAYSAGMLDYFFRGQMDISPPDEGVYAIVDHHAQSCIDTCGFRKIKLKLKNTTPGESMTAGLVVAVAKFHRNACYKPDLSGDPGGTAFSGNACRSATEEILVSDVVNVPSLPGGQLAANAASPTAVSFNFASPIPINATDLTVQIVFRGTLGNELGAVVVATKGMAESNYFAIANSTDYAFDDVGDKRHHKLPFGNFYMPADMMGLGVTLGGVTGPVATLPMLAGGQHAELAYLTDRNAQDVLFTLGGTLTLLQTSLPVSEFLLDAGGASYHRTISFNPSRGVFRDALADLEYVTSRSTPLAVSSCKAGDAGLCDKTTLTTFSSASALEWQINF